MKSGFTGILFVVFLILKLTEVIAWSWWWITAPLWVPAVGAALFLFVMAILVSMD